MTPIPGFADDLRRRSTVGLVLAIQKVAERASGPASGVETKQCAVELGPIGQQHFTRSKSSRLTGSVVYFCCSLIFRFNLSIFLAFWTVCSITSFVCYNNT